MRSAAISRKTAETDITLNLNLDGTGASAAARQDLGPLPHTAVVLLSSLACAWVLIALYFCLKQFKKRKAEHS